MIYVLKGEIQLFLELGDNKQEIDVI